jgi:cytidylate kinase
MPLIAMTREMGSLGRDVATLLAQGLGRQVVYHELVEEGADRARERKTHVERFLQGAEGLWERLDPARFARAMHTPRETFAFAGDGRTAVLRGWGAAHLLKDIPHVIRVRICAPMELRVARMAERLGSANLEAVRAEIDLADEAAAAIARRHFQADWRDPAHYDMVLSTERLTPEECADELEWLMKRERFRETEASRAQAESLARGWDERAARGRAGEASPAAELQP